MNNEIRWVAPIYDWIMERAEENVLGKKRAALLSQLTGNVLDVGIGTGVNFPYYPKHTKIWAIEPSLAMFKLAKKKLIRNKYPAEIQLQHYAFENFPAEGIPPNGFDAIIFTLVLCSVPDLDKAIAKTKSMLRPQGKVFILEHICPQDPIKQKMAKWIQPLWGWTSGGCQLSRHTDEAMAENGFSPLYSNYFQYKVPFYEAILVLN